MKANGKSFAKREAKYMKMINDWFNQKRDKELEEKIKKYIVNELCHGDLDLLIEIENEDDDRVQFAWEKYRYTVSTQEGDWFVIVNPSIFGDRFMMTYWKYEAGRPFIIGIDDLKE